MHKDLLDTLTEIILANELSGEPDLAYRFSDPDGVRTGKSGYSFGICQFDLLNNNNAIKCLADCGFCGTEIATLIMQTADAAEMQRLTDRLQHASAIVDHWDRYQLSLTIRHVGMVIGNAGLHLANEETFLHLCDYHNQFNLELAGKCVRTLQSLQREISQVDVLHYKLTTVWGIKRPDDVERRFRNIKLICRGRSHERIDEIRQSHGGRP